MALLCWHMAVAGLYDYRVNKQGFGTASLSAISSCVKMRYAGMTSLDHCGRWGSVEDIRWVLGFTKGRHVRHLTNVKRISRVSLTDRSRAPPEI